MQALWVLLAAFFFATMSVGVKVAGASFSIAELVFYRGAVSVLFMVVLLRARGVSLRGTVGGGGGGGVGRGAGWHSVV